MKRRQDSDPDDDDNAWEQRAVLPVGEEDGASDSGTPSDGLSYLARVRREAAHPRFVATVAQVEEEEPLPSRPGRELMVVGQRLQCLHTQEAAWMDAFGRRFDRLRSTTTTHASSSDAQWLGRLAMLRTHTRAVDEALCRAAFVLGLRVPDPLTPGAQSDFQFLARLLSEASPDNVLARVALCAVARRVSAW